MKMNDIIEMRKNGATYQEIADAVGVSKQWVQQLITKHAPELKGARGSARRRALEQVTRQQAEIERLQKAGEEAVSCFTRMESLYKIKCKELEIAKAEAVKEFAWRLKATFPKREDSRCTLDDCYTLDYIDNLVKEMTEQSVNYGSSKTEDKAMYQEAIRYYEYGIKCDIFQEPVLTYAKLAVESLEERIKKEAT